MRVYLAPFTKCQLEIHDKCPEGLGTLITRRFMMRIAEKIARRDGASALIHRRKHRSGRFSDHGGACLHRCGGEYARFSPADWSGQDRNHGNRATRSAPIVTLFCLTEDCCTVFTPRHPVTKPKLNTMPDAERKLDVDALVEEAVENTEMIIL